MKKWTFLLIVAAVMLFLSANMASAETVTPKLILDGKVLNPAQPPELIGQYTMVPIRTASENLGYNVDFDNDKKMVTVTGGSNVITMVVNQGNASVNGDTTALQAPPVIKSGTTLVPLRFVGEALGVQVYWDNISKSAFMYSASSAGGSSSGSDSQTPSGPVSGADSNTGSNSGSSSGSNEAPSASAPPEGGLIGVVPPEDNLEGGVTDSSNGVPDSALAQVHSVSFENNSVVLKYSDGSLQPAVTVLTGPDRIVVDLPGADFAADFMPTLEANADGSLKKIGEIAVTGHEALTKIRYSMYSDNPRTIRIVLDLSQRWGYSITNDALTGELRIGMQQPTLLNNGKYTVVLDAGHGGSDPGAPSITGKWEKDFTLSVILKLQAILVQDSRLNVVLTRSGDTYPTLADRYNLANSLNANLFLSVHGNSNTNRSIAGTEVYYTRADSLDFAKVVQQYAVPAGGLRDRGIRQQSLAVTRETMMPAVLYEAGYLSNADDEKILYTDSFQNNVAQGLATAILKYLKLA
ncbi:N-acetylmuramoyl-L-alanine amidase family protein [Cohnella lubricantis]|uniref:N-acetylmuramoyl-L-alanine amidase n=1 Tax=Cohnella lubricantis TaxID=2163172 RepID=A0A841T5H1_9BACL|nr:N-acetylmuramoyl-L-alanine amidase family protein [Cohnella lubricantis]MBB6676564.1 N-acetylmuramoyl-L-alanine amidase [Cohnella lubricantis]MBP2117425.1 N-acetylmuramoyl-L-alanine amidase [Cohnella lubricantis]